jgi:hypothetical protein
MYQRLRPTDIFRGKPAHPNWQVDTNKQGDRATASMSTVIAAIARTTKTTAVIYSFKINYDYYYNSQAIATKCG